MGERSPLPAAMAAIGQMTDAAVTGVGWDAAMDAFAASFNGPGACFHPRGAPDRLGKPASSAYQALLADFLGTYWPGQDLRAQRGWPMADAGAPLLLEQDLTSAEERRTTPIYTDFLAPRDMSIMGGPCFQVGGQMWCVTVVRPERVGCFTPIEQEALMGVRAPLRALVTFADYLAALRGRTAIEALHAVGAPAIAVTAALQVRAINKGAEQLLDEALRIRRGVLECQDTAGRAKLEAAVRRAANGLIAAPFALKRQNRPALVVECFAAPAWAAMMKPTDCVIVRLIDLGGDLALDRGALQQAFSLTNRELDVAEHLLAGRSAQTISKQLGLQESTVRQYIKKVLAKAECSRKADFVLMAGPLKRPEPR